jgi:hypothetical protein
MKFQFTIRYLVLIILIAAAAVASAWWINHQRFNKPPPASLLRSGKLGLLGAPLPVGATLLKQTGPAATGDAGEWYSISASLTDILAFFDEAMIADGWQKSAPDTTGSRSYKKGTRDIVVMTNPTGGNFALTGK